MPTRGSGSDEDSIIHFIVGAEGHEATFKVRPRELCDASPVFKAMLEGSFSESKRRRVSLPDDSPEAMRNIFSIAAMKKSFFEDEPSADELYDLAVAADKYDVVKLVAPYVTQWDVQHKKWKPRNDLLRWAHACLTFGLDDRLEAVGLRLAKGKVLYDGQEKRSWIDRVHPGARLDVSKLDVFSMKLYGLTSSAWHYPISHVCF